MLYKKLHVIFLLAVSAILAFYYLQKTGVNLENYSGPSHKLIFFEEQSFYQGVKKAEKQQQLGYQVRGGIIPHHLFPAFIIADFFKKISFQNPKTIILIGPNHYERGKGPLLTSLYGWETPFGVVAPDSETIKGLIDKGTLIIDEETLVNEHSVAGVMPFIKYYLPKTRVVPIIISSSQTQNEIEAFANMLLPYINNDIVVIAPVDFSHYLTSSQAKEKDKVSLEVIKNLDYRQLYSFNNDYLDSPQSIGALLFLMRERGTTDMEIFNHTNSGELLNNDTVETTSYFSIGFYKKAVR